MNRIVSVAGAVLMLLLLIATTGTAQLQTTTDLNADELQQLREQAAQTVVVDVRTAREFYAGHIPGAINISSQTSNQFRSLPLLLPRDKEIPLVFYCRGAT